MESKSCRRVCVTGSTGYIGSALVKLLLQNGYVVHATLRNLGDESKVGVLRGFPYAKERLRLFEADIYKPQEFEKAIQGCEIVFHVATPMNHTPGYKYNDRIEATTGAIKEIADVCIRSETVRRLVYTASVTAASPLKDDGSGYKNVMDESCWTPLHVDVPCTLDFVKEYTKSKTMAEKEILKIGHENASELEVVSLCCGLVGGGNLLPYCATSMLVLISQVMNNLVSYQCFKYLEDLLGKIPIVHLNDVCRAHVFCAETPSINGRVLCASAYVSSTEIAEYYKEKHPQLLLNPEYLKGSTIEIKWGSTKLEDKGFTYEYDIKMIIDDCIDHAKRCGDV